MIPPATRSLESEYDYIICGAGSAGEPIVMVMVVVVVVVVDCILNSPMFSPPWDFFCHKSSMISLTTGCLLANELTADGSKNVLLLEAGGWDINPLIHIPAGW